jgi:hypothetical protein
MIEAELSGSRANRIARETLSASVDTRFSEVNASLTAINGDETVVGSAAYKVKELKDYSDLTFARLDSHLEDMLNVDIMGEDAEGNPIVVKTAEQRKEAARTALGVKSDAEVADYVDTYIANYRLGFGGFRGELPTNGERLALTAATVQNGDYYRIADDGDGKWAYYRAVVEEVEGVPTITNWIKEADQDGMSTWTASGLLSVLVAGDAANDIDFKYLTAEEKADFDLISISHAINLDNVITTDEFVANIENVVENATIKLASVDAIQKSLRVTKNVVMAITADDIATTDEQGDPITPTFKGFLSLDYAIETAISSGYFYDSNTDNLVQAIVKRNVSNTQQIDVVIAAGSSKIVEGSVFYGDVTVLGNQA